MTLAIPCPRCGAQVGDSCLGADGRWRQQHEERGGGAPASGPLTNYPEDAAAVEQRRGDPALAVVVHPQHPPRADATRQELRDYDDVMGRKL